MEYFNKYLPCFYLGSAQPEACKMRLFIAMFVHPLCVGFSEVGGFPLKKHFKKKL